MGSLDRADSARMFRRAIRRMTAYVPGEQPRPGQRLIKLNTNENPYPPSPAVRRVLAGAAGLLRLYPAPLADELIVEAARLYRLPREMIVAGNGSDELLAMIFRVTLGARDRVAYPLPTYSLYDTLAAIQEATVIGVPWRENFVLPLDELVRARARLTIVCNPNSPSGTCVAAAKLAALARRLAPRLLVIDEAYVDFADGHALELVRRYRNVVVLRSFSKSFSLAGMRLGLGFAHPEIIQQLLKVKDSYNLSRLAIAVGARALRDVAWMRRNVERIKTMRARVEAELRRMGFEVPPSRANFVMARLPGRDLGPLAAGLRKRGILVRYFATPELKDALRISIGTPAEMAALMRALRPLMATPGVATASRRRPAAPAR
ncbi:MAG TPA: histidinol-phosphate transaminase [Candidatus Binataceae bacterium]|nr:histidinol-phosphate transaminase [Candidatus Binataceae bacterium]